MTARFITFEGGEGSGKTTQSKLLFEALVKKGIKVLHTREPGGTEGAEEIRKLLINGDPSKWEANTELLLVMAARAEHVEKIIKPNLAKGITVISDRFIDSTIVYQGYAHGLPIELIRNLHELVFNKFYPDITFILDIDAKVGLERAFKRDADKVTRYERMGMEFHNKILQGFRKLADSDEERYKKIDASLDVETIHQQILGMVE